MKGKVVILGAGSWGTALARTLAQKDIPVVLWARRPELAQDLALTRKSRYLPGVVLPPAVEVTGAGAGIFHGAVVLILAVPSHAVRSTLRSFAGELPPCIPVVNTAKGLEIETLARLSEVVGQELGDSGARRVAVLSGPSHAEEVGRDMPTAVVVAAGARETAEEVQDLFMSPSFRVYTNPDLIGVEMGGSLKNVIALAAGIVDGLELGDNTRAALLTRGLAEISRLGVAMGAHPGTFAGLSGLGDLVVTCNSLHSRNRRAGIQIGQGQEIEQVLAGMGMVVEGVTTTMAACRLARKHSVAMPIAEEVYGILYQGHDPRESVTRLMIRGRTHEVEEVAVDWSAASERSRGTPGPGGS